MSVGHSRRTSRNPSPHYPGCSASSSCRCRSKPSFSSSHTDIAAKAPKKLAGPQAPARLTRLEQAVKRAYAHPCLSGLRSPYGKGLRICRPVSDGETRTRTGDTTICSRAVRALELRGNSSKWADSGRAALADKTPQIPFFSCWFGRWRGSHLPMWPTKRQCRTRPSRPARDYGRALGESRRGCGCLRRADCR
jgi:hypothetical protein